MNLYYLYYKWKEIIFPKGVKRTLRRRKNHFFQKTTKQDLIKILSSLNIPAGAVIMIHAKLSSFGHLVDGPESVIRALEKAVPDCTIVMPTFPFSQSTVKYLSTGQIFDPAHTPSQSGLLSEAFRRIPGAKRSHHPTHPCTALGPEADSLIKGAEYSRTPFGKESTYGRYTRYENAFQLLLDTNSTSIVHCVQERIGMPNLFLNGYNEASSIGFDGKINKYQVKVHIPKLPLYVALPGKKNSMQYLWLPDYCVFFPKAKKLEILNRIENEQVRNEFIAREKMLNENGICSKVKFKNAEVLAIKVKPWMDRICTDLAENIKDYRDWYMPERIQHGLEINAEIEKQLSDS